MFNLGMGEITVILLLALIFLGPSKLPDLAAGLGKIIKEIRKATSDVKNEIAMDESFRKPFEDLRDAVTLHPDELKRRDLLRKDMEEATKRAAEETARAEAESAQGIDPPQLPPPPDGLASPVKIPGVSLPGLKPGPHPGPIGPNDTIVQAAPDPADFPPPPSDADIPTPPPERVTTKAKPVGRPAAPTGTVARADTLRKGVPAVLGGFNGKAAPPAFGRNTPTSPGQAPAPATPAPIAPASGPARAATAPIAPAPAGAAPGPAAGGDAANITQILKEEDLIPSTSSGKPPPPPHLPGLVRAPTPRPGSVPPMPPVPDTKKKT